MIITEADDFGAYVNLNKNQPSVLTPMAAGIVLPVGTDQPVILGFNDEYKFRTYGRGTIALDGEREIEFHKDQTFIIKISRNGPIHVDIRKAIEIGQINGFFKVSK